MNRVPFLGRGRPIVLLAALILSSQASRAQQEPEERPKQDDSNTVYVPAKGMEGFRYILHRRGLEPIQSVDELDDPANTVIVLLGPKSVTKCLDPRIIKAVEGGASLLVATNGPTDSELETFGVRVLGVQINCADKDYCYRHIPSSPFVDPITGTEQGDALSRHSVFDGIKKLGDYAIATNEAAAIRLTGRSIRPEPLATYPKESMVYRGPIVSSRSLNPSGDFFAVGGTLGKGRFLILADPSVFGNRMVLAFDNANKEFIHSCMDWLQGQVDDVNKKRSCLFIEDGEIKTNFDLPMLEENFPWLNLLGKTLTLFERHGDKMAAELEERDFFNKVIFSQFTLRQIIRSGIILLTFVLLILGFVRSVRSRASADPARTLITPELAAMIPRGSVLQQRFGGQIASDNLYEPVRGMVRNFLGGLDAEPDSHGQPPFLQMKDGHPNASELREKIMRLWHIGFGTQPLKVTPREWRGMVKDLKKILEDADRGWWKFLPLNKA